MIKASGQNILTSFRRTLYLTWGLLCLGEAALLWAAGGAHRWLLAALMSLLQASAFIHLQRRLPRYSRRFAFKPRHYRQADQTLRIAHETLPIMRLGLNPETARKTAEIIQKISDVAAVAVTDREKVLAFIGVGCDKHLPGDEILTEATKEAVATGEIKIVKSQRQLNCPRRDVCDCPLAAAVIVPLLSRGQVVGTVKLYETKDGEMPPYIVKLASGISQLLGMQVELAELDHQVQLTCRAELDALRAQINPHFFFNTLNTIIMYSRTSPEKTRRLLIRLAEFFRQTLKSSGHFHTFQEELHYIRTYLYLERARFNDKLHVRYRIDPQVLQAQVPVLTIQPIVENAVKHGIGQKLGPGAVEISAEVKDGSVTITVADDGAGIPQEILGKVLQPGFGSGNGVGLSNVWERTRRLYGDEFRFSIDSQEGEGTVVSLSFPLNYEEGRGGVTHEAEGTHRG